MGQKTIVIVEDDMRLRELTSAFLYRNGFHVVAFETASGVLDLLAKNRVDLIILDVMLPGIDGFLLCKQIRLSYKGPVLFLTAKTELSDELNGFELGADDYVTKPVEPSVLLARVNALLRRMPERISVGKSHFQFGNLQIFKQARKVLLDDKPVVLTSHEFDLLVMLAENAGQVVERERIYSELIGREYDGLDRSADVRISRLRKKLGDNAKNPFKIKTIWGKGFYFISNAWE